MGTQFLFLNPAFVLAALLTLLNSGVRDLVGLIPTDDYWKAKGVAVSTEQLTHELQAVKETDVSTLIADLDADDPQIRDEATRKIAAIGLPARAALEQAAREGSPETAARANSLLARIRVSSKAWSIRRLMAIRTLGERKEPKSLDVLRPLLTSKEPFEADYASAAIARIQGMPYQAPTASDADRASDVGLLPARLDALAQITLDRGGGPSIDKIMAGVTMPPDQREKIVGALLKAAETSGNIRLDAVTAGFYAAPPGIPGNFAYIARGEFDPSALSALLATLIPKSSKVEGGELFTFDEDNVLLVTNDRRVIYLVREPMGQLGLDEIIDGLKRGASDFADNPDLPKLMKTIDTKAPFWAAMRFNPGMREIAGPLGEFEDATIVGKPGAGHASSIDLQLLADASDPARGRQAAAGLDATMKNAVSEGRAQEKGQPLIKPMVDFVASVKVDCNNNGKTTVTATMPDLTSVLPIVGPGQALDVPR